MINKLGLSNEGRQSRVSAFSSIEWKNSNMRSLSVAYDLAEPETLLEKIAIFVYSERMRMANFFIKMLATLFYVTRAATFKLKKSSNSSQSNHINFS